MFRSSSSNELDEEPKPTKSIELEHQYDIAAIVAILDSHDLSFHEYRGKIKLADGAYAFLCLVLKAIDNLSDADQDSQSTLKDINLAVISNIINQNASLTDTFYRLLALLSDEIITRYFYDNFNSPWEYETTQDVYLRELTPELKGIFAYEKVRYADELDNYYQRIGLEGFIKNVECLVEQSSVESFEEEKNNTPPSAALLELTEAMSVQLLDFLSRVIGSHELLPDFMIKNCRRVFASSNNVMYVGTYLLLYHINPRILDAAMQSTVGFTKQLIIDTIIKPLQIIANNRTTDLKINQTEQTIYEKIYHPVDGVLIIMDGLFKKFLEAIIQPQSKKQAVPQFKQSKTRDSLQIGVQQRFRVVLTKEFYGKGLKWNSVLLDIINAIRSPDDNTSESKSSPDSVRKLHRGKSGYFKKDSVEADAARELNRTFSNPELQPEPTNSSQQGHHRFNLVSKFRRRNSASSPPRTRKRSSSKPKARHSRAPSPTSSTS